MPDPKFKVGQRVYVNANPYHGKVTHVAFWGGGYHYHLELDMPNPLDQPVALYGERGLSGTFDEAVAWRKDFDDWAENRSGWICVCGLANEEPRVPACRLCGRLYSDQFPKGGHGVPEE